MKREQNKRTGWGVLYASFMRSTEKGRTGRKREGERGRGRD